MKHFMNIFSYKIQQYDNDKLWCFHITNEIKFYKRKFSAPRVEQGRTLIPFSAPVSFACSELISSLLMSNYTYFLTSKIA